MWKTRLKIVFSRLWTSIHYFSVKSLTVHFWFHTHSFVLRTKSGFLWSFCLFQKSPLNPSKPRGFLRSQGIADWFGTGFLKPVIAKMTRVKLLWFTYNQVVVSKMDPKFTPKHRKNGCTRACTYRIKQSPIVRELQGRHCSHYHYSWRFLVCGWLTRNQKAGVTGLLLAKCFCSNMVKITIRKYSCCNFANFFPHIFLGKLKFWY